MQAKSTKEPKFRNLSVIRALKINSSSREQGSVTRELTDSLLNELRRTGWQLQVKERDVAKTPLPLIDEAWINAGYTQQDQRSALQQQRLAKSDRLIDELHEADVIIIGVPLYNFSIPATLKAWIDQVARAGVTFRYTENGPVGLLKGKKAYVVLASGGVPVGGEADFASNYLRHVLGFIGIKDVEIIAADRLNIDKEDSLQKAQRHIQRAALAMRNVGSVTYAV